MTPKFCTISGFPSNGKPSKDEDIVKMSIGSQIIKLYRQGYKDFVCNCELGVALWAAELIAGLKTVLPIRLNIAVPHETQAAGWQDFWHEIYYELHEKADAVLFVNKQFRAGCYDECDRFMLDNSDVLLYVGSEPAYITDYAAQTNKPVIFLENAARL
ncbi:MAG: SLOG family protein [Oscillospiraceae bacterium]